MAQAVVGAWAQMALTRNIFLRNQALTSRQEFHSVVCRSS